MRPNYQLQISHISIMTLETFSFFQLEVSLCVTERKFIAAKKKAHLEQRP
jgi:hypothetical protein